jgi:death-on-curing protein
MRYVTLREVVALQQRIIAATGGAGGMRELAALESAVAQPRANFGGEDLYPSVIEKAAALGFSLVMGHPFLDGNKRTGHAAMETFLVLNGYEVSAPADEQERVMLQLAAGDCQVFCVTRFGSQTGLFSQRGRPHGNTQRTPG